MAKSLYLALGLASLVAGCTEERIERVIQPSTYQTDCIQNKRSGFTQNIVVVAREYRGGKVSASKTVNIEERVFECQGYYYDPKSTEMGHFPMRAREIFPDGITRILPDNARGLYLSSAEERGPTPVDDTPLDMPIEIGGIIVY